MTKKEVCLNNDVFAYYTGLGGVELHHIEYGIDDYIYCKANAWTSNKTYHKLKIHYHDNGHHYIKLNGYKIPLADCIRCSL